MATEYGQSIKWLPLIVTDGRGTDDYHLGMASDDPAKVEQRRDVLSLFMEYHNAAENFSSLPRFLTMPGEHWRFEQAVSSAIRCDITGLEWCWPVAERGMRWMPQDRAAGACLASRRRRTPDPQARMNSNYVLQTEFGEVQGYKTSNAKVLNLYASTFLKLERGEVSPPRSSRRKDDWYERSFRAFSGVWLDFTSGACPETMDALMAVHRAYSCAAGPVALAVTMMLGRDNLALPNGATPLDSRLAFVKQCLSFNNERRPRTLSATSYRSQSDVTMLSFLFELGRLPSACVLMPQLSSIN